MNVIQEAIAEVSKVETSPSLVRVLHALSMDTSCFEEQTGDSTEWTQWACLFKFGADEVEQLCDGIQGVTVDDFTEENGTWAIALREDSNGFHDVISAEEYRAIDREYSEYIAEHEDEEKGAAPPAPPMPNTSHHT